MKFQELLYRLHCLQAANPTIALKEVTTVVPIQNGDGIKHVRFSIAEACAAILQEGEDPENLVLELKAQNGPNENTETAG